MKYESFGVAALVAATLLAPLGIQAAGGQARKAIAGAGLTGFAVGSSTSVFVTGNNNFRQQGPQIPSTTGFSNTTAGIAVGGYPRSMALGDYHGIVALDDGSVQVWGAVDYMTGSGPTTADPAPRLLHYPLFRSARQVAAGLSASYVLLQGGTLYSLGYNTNGQLGTGSVGGSPSSIPQPVLTPANIVAVDAKCDTAAVDDTGRLFTWGNNAAGQLGIGAAGGASGAPSHVLSDVVQVAVGCDFIVALQRSGAVLAWGANNQGQLGQNNTIPRATPTVVPLQNVISIGAGYYHAHGIFIDGTLAGWGRNSEGQLGTGAFSASVLSPVAIGGITTAMSVTGGDYHTVLIRQGNQDDAEIWTAGYNAQGQLGTLSPGSNSNVFTFMNGGFYNPPTMRRTGLRNSGNADIAWYNTSSGETGFWQASPTPSSTTFKPLRTIAPGFAIFGTGDINFDDLTEIFFYNAGTGEIHFWATEGTVTPTSADAYIWDEGFIGSVLPSSGWRPQQVGDLDGDGIADILFRNIINGNVAIWYLTSEGRIGRYQEFPSVPLEWQIVKTGDFDGNGVEDILWRNTSTGQINIWFKSVLYGSYLDINVGSAATSWVPQVVSDFDGDGRSDILWHNKANGSTFIWYMMGNIFAGKSGPIVPTEWNAQAVAMTNSDAPQSSIIWRHGPTGDVWYWTLDNRPTAASFTPSNQGSAGNAPVAWQIGQ